MSIRIREAAELAGCVSVLRRVHEASGYPSRWPDDPGGWLTPRSLVGVVADSLPAIALYEQAGWQLAGTQPATWANPDGTTPILRGYVRPRPRFRASPAEGCRASLPRRG